ncbi:hypothetical protein wVul_0665 [Wolbachia endosymbiont of Armadillidium vulgare str. wVulC]|nr:hypothetical protein wVul_0665 [Wolbachia endosymbiont of Armadillidium vulgare str. wVulC]
MSKLKNKTFILNKKFFRLTEKSLLTILNFLTIFPSIKKKGAGKKRFCFLKKWGQNKIKGLITFPF